MAANESTSNIAVQLTCPSKNWLGLPCPGCGTTRSLLSILSGNFEYAIWLNPLGYFALVFLIIAPPLFLIDMLTKKQTVWVLYTKTEHILQNKIVQLTVLIFILANWYWNWIKFA